MSPMKQRSPSNSSDDLMSLTNHAPGQVLVMGQPLTPNTSGPGFVLLTTRNIQGTSESIKILIL